VAKLTMISYWAFDAMKNLMDTELRDALGPTGAPMVVAEAGLRSDLLAIAGLFALFLAAAWLALRRGEAR
jgi:hypothetical protein